MKQSIIIITIAIISLLIATTRIIHAQMGSMMDTENQTDINTNHTEPVETILREILDKQNVSILQELDLSKISDNDWERLGDAVMEQMHPGSSHELMDEMMGGEGSESLRQMHINMGKSYLGYGGNYGPAMMGGGMMGNWNTDRYQKRGGFPMMGFGSMMGYDYGNKMMGGSYSIIGSITWLAIIVFLLAGAYFFIMQANKGRNKGK